jgi:hypothetical protein
VAPLWCCSCRCSAGLLIPPILLYDSLIAGAEFLGQAPSAARQADAAALLWAAAVTAVGLPPGRTGARPLAAPGVACWLFGIALVIGPLPALLVVVASHGRRLTCRDRG